MDDLNLLISNDIDFTFLAAPCLNGCVEGSAIVSIFITVGTGHRLNNGCVMESLLALNTGNKWWWSCSFMLVIIAAFAKTGQKEKKLLTLDRL